MAHLTRNVVIRSARTAKIDDRGHVMFMNKDVDIQYVRFLDLGRTDKTVLVNDSELDGNDELVPGTGTNQRARYPLHFHQNGVVNDGNPSIIHGCVVEGTPGWGFVNHSSFVDFMDNVCFDFDGAGFVTEAGDEIGAFVNNISLGGAGNGDFKFDRTYFKYQNPDFEWHKLSDFGIFGEGFFFTGPTISVSNNVAAGCMGPGFMYLCTGKIEPDSTFTDGDYVGVPDGNFPSFYNQIPRRWIYNNTAVAQSLPPLLLENSIAYGCYMGLKLRFVNHPGDANWYSQVGGFNTRFIAGNGQTDYFDINTLTIWNCEKGILTSYVGKYNANNVTILASGIPNLEPAAIDSWHAINGQLHWDTVRIEGYNFGWKASDTNPGTGGNATYNNVTLGPGVIQFQ